MESEFERSAKAAAVEAVERRYEHNRRVRMRSAAKLRLRKAFSALGGLMVLAAIGLYFWRDHVDFSSVKSLDFNSISDLPQAIAKCFSGIGSGEGGDVTSHCGRFSEAAAKFSAGELLPWKDAPEELKSDKTASDVTFLAVIPYGEVFRLFEIRREPEAASIVELTPFGRPLPVTAEQFRTARIRGGCIVAYGGRLFAWGGDVKRLRRLQQSIDPTAGEHR